MLPFDINQAVSNPALSAALDALTRADTAATRQQAALEIGRATYLVAILDDEIRSTPGRGPGEATWQAGSRFGVLTADDGQDGQVLPLFTDWDAIRAWANRPVSALVMPAAEAWAFALAGDTYSGVVLNPAQQGIFIAREALRGMTSDGPGPNF